MFDVRCIRGAYKGKLMRGTVAEMIRRQIPMDQLDSFVCFGSEHVTKEISTSWPIFVLVTHAAQRFT
jgi:hypothetical protein